ACFGGGYLLDHQLVRPDLDQCRGRGGLRCHPGECRGRFDGKGCPFAELAPHFELNVVHHFLSGRGPGGQHEHRRRQNACEAHYESPEFEDADGCTDPGPAADEESAGPLPTYLQLPPGPDTRWRLFSHPVHRPGPPPPSPPPPPRPKYPFPPHPSPRELLMPHSRREFLADVGKGMIAAGLGAGLATELGLCPAIAGDEPKALSFGTLEPLVAFLQETPKDKLLPLVVEKLNAGTDLKRLTAAAAFANARTFR